MLQTGPRERRGRVPDRLGARPGLVPVGAAGDVERDQQRRPGGEAPDAFGNDAGPARMAGETGCRFVEPVAADEGEVHERRDPETHVIEPDQHAQPIVGQEPGEDGEAPILEAAGGQEQVRHRRGPGAHGAVLVIPGRIGRLAQERIDDRGHPEAPPQHANGLFDEALEPASADELLQWPEGALKQGRQDEEVDREQRRRDTPVDDAGERFIEEKPDAVAARSEIHRAVFVEQRVDRETRDRMAGRRIAEVGVAPELRRHDGDLLGFEVPADGPGHETSEHEAQCIDPPTFHDDATSARPVDGIASDIDARVGDAAQHEPRHETRDPALGRHIERKGERHPESDHGSPQVGPWIAIAGAQAPDEGWRAIRAGDQRLGQGEQQSAAEDRGNGRDRPRQRHDARHRQQGGQGHDDGHEDAAVDEPLRGAAAPLPVSRRIGRGRSIEGVDRETRHDIDDRPEAGLGQGGGRDRHEGLDRPEAADQHRQVCDMGRHDGVERRAEQQRVEAPVARETAGNEEAANPDRHLAEGEEDEHPPHHEVDGFGERDAAGRDAAEVVHHAAVADRHQQVEH